ncbi:MAG: ferric reductase-like transmembrane domain-containing protein [Verrucomicrobia bacterium]|nr:ferric reductase-like transmembrane domain-containing protein [Verrucomicrobiota bacterium]
MLNLFKKKLVIWTLCALPFAYIFVLAWSNGLASTEFWHWNIKICGYTAVALLAICLVSAPLHKMFSASKILSVLHRHQRETGLASFFYALVHATSYFIEKRIRIGEYEWIYLLHPVIIPGWIALAILLALAVTSNQFSIKKLTYKKWKNLHRAVYIAEGAVFFHMVFQGGQILLWGCLIFIPLFIAQSIRWKKKA